MDKDKLGEAIKAISNSFASRSEQEANKRITEALKFINESDFKIKGPEDFDLFIGHKVEQCMNSIVKTLHDVPTMQNSHMADFIFVHYSFLEHNIRELCSLREGSCCCADKSRHIIKMFLRYAIDGTIPEFDPDLEKYWTPNFGDNQMWIDLCNGLYRLHFGYTEEYFKAYKALVECDIRKYKHVRHDWYIKYQNGEEFRYANTWDDNVDIPLEIENGCYILRDKYVVGNYPKYKSNDEESSFLYKNSVCVPIEDVLVYSRDIEVMC